MNNINDTIELLRRLQERKKATTNFYMLAATKKAILDEVSEILKYADTLPIDEATDIENQMYDIILEGDTFFTSNGGKYPSICIRIDDESTQGKAEEVKPYFGVYDSASYGKAKNMARVDIKNSEILNHRNVGPKAGLGHLKANSKQMEALSDIMDAPCTNKKYKGLTVKEAICKYYSERGISLDPEDFDSFENFKDNRSKDKLNKKVH